jgi:hypothetical protein
MSNLSDIGFPVTNEHDVNQVIMDIMPHLERIPVGPDGFYYKFEDDSGAQIYLQTNSAQEIIGFNPAFSGESRRRVELTEAIERDTSDLDGAFRCLAKTGSPTAPSYPFVFDTPDFKTYGEKELPLSVDVSLTAFASNDFQIFADKDEFSKAAQDDSKVAEKSFIPSGLFSFDEDGEPVEQDPPQAHAIITGVITDCQKRKNGFTGAEFYFFCIESFGGFADIVADPALIKSEPKPGGIVKGSFWLSGKLV